MSVLLFSLNFHLPGDKEVITPGWDRFEKVPQGQGSPGGRYVCLISGVATLPPHHLASTPHPLFSQDECIQGGKTTVSGFVSIF